MPEAQTIPTDDGGVAVVVEVPAEEIGQEEIGEEIVEAIEEASSDAVEIARIEADRDVTIAAIHAETETARVDAIESNNAEINEMRERITWLESQLTSTQEQNRQLQEQLTPPASPPEVEEVTEVTETVTTDTSETNSETSSSTQTEAPEKSEEGAPEAEAEVKVKRRLRFL